LTSKYHIAVTTCPTLEIATQLANEVVEQQLAACVNIIPSIKSVYKWKDKIEHDDESLLIIKTVKQQLASLEKLILRLHPYETPEFISMPIESGSKAYLDWITSSMESKTV